MKTISIREVYTERIMFNWNSFMCRLSDLQENLDCKKGRYEKVDR